MKVSFTSSFWKVPEIEKIYHTCDEIFTTNWDALSELRDIFGYKINLLPHGYCWVMHGIQKDIKETYPDAEILEFGDITKIVNNLLYQGDWETHMLLLKHNGLEIRDVLLYDEEGVEGFEWFRKNGESLGTAISGDVPSSVRDIFKPYERAK